MMSNPFYSNKYPPIFVSKHRYVFIPPSPRPKADEEAAGERREGMDDEGTPGAHTARSH